jgi:hypothetical protein
VAGKVEYWREVCSWQEVRLDDGYGWTTDFFKQQMNGTHKEQPSNRATGQRSKDRKGTRSTVKHQRSRTNRTKGHGEEEYGGPKLREHLRFTVEHLLVEVRMEEGGRWLFQGGLEIGQVEEMQLLHGRHAAVEAVRLEGHSLARYQHARAFDTLHRAEEGVAIRTR